MIKAIETKYAGCRFRSRLEARWAVFFDACGIKWQYEPEGFALSNGGAYLPDFYLTDKGVYVEIKREDGDFSKAEQFAIESGLTMILLDGLPEMKYYSVFTSADNIPYPFFIGPVIHKKGIQVSWLMDGLHNPIWKNKNWFEDAKKSVSDGSIHKELRKYNAGWIFIKEAMEKATSARFEFGEKG